MTLAIPRVVKAAKEPTMIEAALGYAMLGMSVVPLDGKRAKVDWIPFQKETAALSQIHRWHSKGLLHNVGIVTGAVSGNLVVIDLDGDDAITAFARYYPKLQNTYTVASGSGHGQHLYYYVEQLPRTTRATGTSIGNVELRANGCYVAAPPSQHPVTGEPYTVANESDIRRVDDLDDVVEWIRDLIECKYERTIYQTKSGKVHNPRPYLLKATWGEMEKLIHSPEGNRNNQLNLSAFKLGQIAGNDSGDRDFVLHSLIDAARLANLVDEDGERQCWATIKSGFNAGLLKPRSNS